MTKKTTQPPQPPVDPGSEDVWGDLFGEMLSDSPPATPQPGKAPASTRPPDKPMVVISK